MKAWPSIFKLADSPDDETRDDDTFSEDLDCFKLCDHCLCLNSMYEKTTTTMQTAQQTTEIHLRKSESDKWCPYPKTSVASDAKMNETSFILRLL